MGQVQRAFFGLVAALATATLAPSARAEVIPATTMAKGVTMSQMQCALLPNSVWVMIAKQGYCVRYYVSTAGGKGLTPVVFLQGDQLGKYDSKNRAFPAATSKDDVDTKELQDIATLLSKLSATTGIYIGRPGIEGSSGFHGHRRTWLELYIVNAALDAIKRLHGYQGYHLVGQSGGAALVGGLIILRGDISCAVPGSGPLAGFSKGPQTQALLLQYFDPVREIAAIARRRGLRVIVITDPEDQRVKAEHQTGFVTALQKAGGRVEQYFVRATDDIRHGVAAYAVHAVAGCVKSEKREQIQARLAVVQERKLAAAEKARQQKAASTQPAPSGQPPQQPRRS